MARAKECNITVPDPDEFNIEVGMGVVARLGDKKILIGKNKFLRDKGADITDNIEKAISEQTEQGRTTILVANDLKPVGLIAIADEIRPETPHAIASLKAMGIKEIIMLTGDNYKVAKAVAEEIGVDDFQAELLPEQKLQYVEKLQKQGKVVGMIGDGINDAPALARANVGISMGEVGSSTAIEASDIVFLKDDISSLAWLYKKSCKTTRVVKENLALAISVIVLATMPALFGIIPLWLAVILHEGGTIIVSLNSLRLLKK